MLLTKEIHKPTIFLVSFFCLLEEVGIFMEDEKTETKKTYISVLALTMMNVSIVAGLANDVQQPFYGLASVTYFAIGAIFFFIPTALVAA